MKALILLLIFTTNLYLAYSQTKSCVDAPATRGPCQCLENPKSIWKVRRLVCENFDGPEELIESLSSMRGISFTNLKLANGKLTACPEDLFRGIRSIHLSLKNVEVDETLSFSDGQMDIGLETVTIEDVTGLSKISWSKAFGSSWFMHQFQVENSPIACLPVDFEAIGNRGAYVTIVRISDAKMQCVDDLSLSSFTKATVIDLSDNALTVVRRKMFPICVDETSEEACIALTVLNLSNNRLTSLPDDLLSGFEKLSVLSISGNQLKSLNQQLILGSASKHINVDLYDNYMDCGKELCWILQHTWTLKVTGTCRDLEYYSFSEALRQKSCLQ